MLQLNIILHPTDFSENSRGALKVAHSLARDHKARLLLISVVDPPPTDIFFVSEPLIATGSATSHELHGAKEKIAHMAASITDIPVETEVVVGQPADVIIDAAENRNADLIVMGTHGRTGVAHLLMGSIAECVMRRAECPVLTIRPGTAKHLGNVIPSEIVSSTRSVEESAIV